MRHRRGLVFCAIAALVVGCASKGIGGDGSSGGASSGGAGDGGPPPPRVCSAGCPAGYTCSDGVCTGGDPSALRFDVRTFAISGTLTAAKAAPVAGKQCSGDQVRIEFLSGPPRESFLDPDLGTAVSGSIACRATDGSFAARVPAGTYRILASRYDSSSSFPDATFVVNDALPVAAEMSGLAWDVSTSVISGRITAGGIAPMSGSGCSGSQVRLMFVDANGASFSGDVPCGATNGAFSARVAPGTYRVLANRYDSSSTFPNATFVVDPAFRVTGDASDVAWDVVTRAVSGRITADGRPPTAGTSCSQTQVRLTFVGQNGATFDANVSCGASDGAFFGSVAPGTYKVLAHRYDSSSSFPDATFVLDPAFKVSGDAAGIAWNVTTRLVSGRVTIDGQAPVSLKGCSGTQVRLSFVDPAGASFDADVPCSATDGSFSGRVAPGTYRVSAQRYDSSSTFPNASFLVDPSFRVTDDVTALTFNLTTRAVAGAITADGQAPTATKSCSGAQVRLSFLDVRGAMFDAEVPCRTTDGAFSARIEPGTYRVLASRYDSSSTFPDATFNLVDAIDIR